MKHVDQALPQSRGAFDVEGAAQSDDGAAAARVGADRRIAIGDAEHGLSSLATRAARKGGHLADAYRDEGVLWFRRFGDQDLQHAVPH